MSRGTPHTLKCPKCKRGKWLHPPQIKGVRPTGEVEAVKRRSNHRGCGQGGRGFYGYRGLVECLDCGHKWYSTHPNSGRQPAQPKTQEEPA